MSQDWVKSVKPGAIYCARNYENEDSSFIVTGVGLDHVLFSNYPLIKFNGTYLEYCKSRKEFQENFRLLNLQEE